ncbi:hypothetical protein Pmar_PMAR022143 [Perkinsus marinus ATCC 50983]|uniref:Uncharacterized protein n=1 Tax=Perkinsus marinus (strain ATCC 50983 / TXsc) TaxID=423536 RepID=C5L0Q4_PERM5|nr:hypothetical protein Pmar_PMAR022143 [Perkinsus marinus ATCC 50983]EER09706.1 hypothetical protein Pmar_PMAR022143 [Perkinsus marinus ATCC 50983]|eukprot:XP_002777911.1 hypothetical protein Pmar_PMAR022143 [Perkinsus marinus ATCC 50983]
MGSTSPTPSTPYERDIGDVSHHGYQLMDDIDIEELLLLQDVVDDPVCVRRKDKVSCNHEFNIEFINEPVLFEEYPLPILYIM